MDGAVDSGHERSMDREPSNSVSSPRIGSTRGRLVINMLFGNATSVSAAGPSNSHSHRGTNDSTLVSISTRFNLESPDIQDSDLVLVSSDNVYFYAHKTILLHHSSNYFGSLLGPNGEDRSKDGDLTIPAIGTHKFVTTDHNSEVLNVVLHAIYKFSVQSFRPPPSTLQAATKALFDLGYDLNDVFPPHSELFMLFLQAGVTDPLEMYALAAQFSLEQLAVAVSTFTLSVSPSGISDELAIQMGPVYLRRLFFLHLGRADALKRLLYPPPMPHPAYPDPNCGHETQSAVARIWAIACATVVVENNPSNLAATFAPLSAQLPCARCRQSLQERVTRLINDWSSVKCTI